MLGLGLGLKFSLDPSGIKSSLSLICLFLTKLLRYGSTSGEAFIPRVQSLARSLTPFMIPITWLTSWIMTTWLAIDCLIYYTLF
ncbi:hypothetical protein P5673_021369 [Acropora cervicornis]|uniref:Uncharacterized protein n=1 Tax=Acropora cervicornis TaxID=6130 RepID=A0AAD9Q832_ACRCE|nr:hypothetical protein P5673_021369 [Acropora cervicornis]